MTGNKNGSEFERFNGFVFDPYHLFFIKSESFGDVNLADYADKSPVPDSKTLSDKLFRYNPGDVSLRPGQLSGAGISLTSNCNFRCTYCCESSVSGHVDKLTLDDVKAFVDDLILRWGMHKAMFKTDVPMQVYFTGGGEPTFNWDLFVKTVEYIRTASELNNVPWSLGLTTNGLLDDSKLSFISKNFDLVMVSYDGLPEIQSRNRLCPTCNQVDDAVSHTIRYLQEAGCKVTVRTTVWFEDVFRIPEMAEHVFSSFPGIFSWDVLPITPAGRALNRYDGLSGHDPIAFLNCLDEAKELVKDKYGADNISTSYYPNSIPKYYCNALTFSCKCPWLIHDGRIITCMEPCDSKVEVGYVSNGVVHYHDQCEDHFLRATQNAFKECACCPIFCICKGGCPAKRIMGANNGHLRDWCDSALAYWYRIFNEITLGNECYGWKLEPVDSDDPSSACVFVLSGHEEVPEEEIASHPQACELSSRVYVYLPSSRTVKILTGISMRIWKELSDGISDDDAVKDVMSMTGSDADESRSLVCYVRGLLDSVRSI